MADASTRHFWHISYGQIYPELKTLERAVMVQAAEAARGSRQRTLHQLTDTGAEALSDWISDSTVAPVELRDEMLLKLFFSDAVAKPERIALAPDEVALPGLTDAHMHLARAAIATRHVDLTSAVTLDEGLARIRAAHELLPDASTWLEGHGWDSDRWGGWPTAAGLESVAPGRPVALWAHDHHALLASRAALAIAGAPWTRRALDRFSHLVVPVVYLALGVSIACAGVITHPVVLAGGALLASFALAAWVVDTVRGA